MKVWVSVGGDVKVRCYKHASRVYNIVSPTKKRVRARARIRHSKHVVRVRVSMRHSKHVVKVSFIHVAWCL